MSVANVSCSDDSMWASQTDYKAWISIYWDKNFGLVVKICWKFINFLLIEFNYKNAVLLKITTLVRKQFPDG